MAWLATSALCASAALASVAIWTDWRSRCVPHAVPVGLAVLWLLTAFGAPDALGGPLWAGVLCATVVLVAGFACHAVGWLGAGDGKLLAALALWLGPGDIGFALLGGAGLLLILLLPAWAGIAPDFRRRGLPVACAVTPPSVVLLVARALQPSATCPSAV